jgi:hypothetical protein
VCGESGRECGRPAAVKPEAVSAGAISHSCHPLELSQGGRIIVEEQAQSEGEYKPVTGGSYIATPKDA